MFNDTQEHIIYILPQKPLFFVATIKQSLRYDGKIDKFDLNGYFLDNRTNSIDIEKVPVNMHCSAVYNEKAVCLRNIHIIDFTINEMWQNQGYGSIVMKQLIKFAKYMNVSYISGELSFRDFGTSDDNETKRENRERLYHFYTKFGFEIDAKNNTIRLDLRE